MRLRLGELAPFVARLDLDLARTRICLACLSFVSMSFDHGDEHEARVWARRMTPWLWEEGLDEQALAAVRKARFAGVPGAEMCLADLEERGGSSVVARAVVLRLARQLSERTRTELWLEEAARPRLALARPELN